MNTSPGYGTQQIHLGQAGAELAKILGKPAKRITSSELREYWVYPESHFEAIVSRRNNRLLSLFFHAGSSLAGQEFFGRSEEAIRGIFGNAHKGGGGTTFSDGEYLSRWFAYDTGITFFFDQADRVKTVGISAPKRAVKRASVAKHGEGLSMHVAALRRA